MSLRKAYQTVPERPGLSSPFRRMSHGLTQHRGDASARSASTMLVTGRDANVDHSVLQISRLLIAGVLPAMGMIGRVGTGIRHETASEGV